MTDADPFIDLSAGLASAELRQAFAQRRFDAAEIGSAREAAVLVLLTQNPDPAMLFIERAEGMRHHAGQIAFPGGGLDPGETPLDAALRETFEEIALPAEAITVLGALPDAQIPVSKFHVHAFVGSWSGTEALSPQPQEVAAVHQVPVSVLADPTVRTSWRHTSGTVGPGFTVDGVYIWGFTAFVVDAVLRAGGWATPWDSERFADIPPRFMRDRR